MKFIINGPPSSRMIGMSVCRQPAERARYVQIIRANRHNIHLQILHQIDHASLDLLIIYIYIRKFIHCIARIVRFILISNNISLFNF